MCVSVFQRRYDIRPPRVNNTQVVMQDHILMLLASAYNLFSSLVFF